MQVLFETRSVEKRLATRKARVREFGEPVANKLDLRLSQLNAANTLEEMRSLGRTHELSGDRRGHLAIDVTRNLRLVFEPANEPLPARSDGGLDWARVTSIRIKEVTDYHD